MYECGVDKQLICEKTGHQSVAVRGYKRTSSNQLRDVSNILYGNNSEVHVKKAKVEPTATISKPSPDSSGENVSESKAEEMSVTNAKSDNTSINLPKGMVVNINFNVMK